MDSSEMSTSERFEFAAIVCEEREGGYSIFAEHYPEVISQGKSIEEARENLCDAFLGMLAAKKSLGESLRYCEASAVPTSATSQRIRISLEA